MSFLWAVFHGTRRLMDILCAKVDLLDPNSTRPKIRSAEELTWNTECDIAPLLDDVIWDFRKEHLHQLRAARGDVSSAQLSAGGDLKHQTGNQFHGDNKKLKGESHNLLRNHFNLIL